MGVSGCEVRSGEVRLQCPLSLLALGDVDDEVAVVALIFSVITATLTGLGTWLC